MADYSVWVSDSYGNRRGVVGSLVSLRAVQAIDDVGVLELIFSSAYEYSLFELDSIIEVYRTAPGGLVAQLFEAAWLARVFQAARANGIMQYTVYAYSLNYLLAGRTVPYPKGGAKAFMTDYADDMMKAIVRENLGSLATDATRSLAPYLAVQADRSVGPTIAKEFAYKPVLATLQEIAASASAEGTPIYFDIVSLGSAAVGGAAFEFRTYAGQRGVDHSMASGADPIEVSEERGNLADPSLRFDYSAEVNHVYVGGQGEGIGRTIQTAQDAARVSASPFNRRETFIDAQNTEGTDGLGAEGSAELRAGRPRIVFEGQLVDVPSARFGVDWNLGDRVAARFAGHYADCRVDAIDIAVAENGLETITARLRDEA